MLGAQQAKADRAARRALGVAPMAEVTERDLFGVNPPGLGEAANLRARALEAALLAATVDIIAPDELFATAESYYAFITGGTDG